MLSLDSPRWQELEHAYGSAEDIPALLEQLDSAAIAPKLKFIGATFGLAWLLPMACFAGVTMLSFGTRETLERLMIPAAQPSMLVIVLRQIVEAITSYWFVAGQFLIPTAAAVLAFPLSTLLGQRILERDASNRNVA